MKKQTTKILTGSIASLALVGLFSVAVLKGCAADSSSKQENQSLTIKQSNPLKRSTDNKKKVESAKESEKRTEKTVEGLYGRAGIITSSSKTTTLTPQELQEISTVSQVLTAKKKEASKQEEAKDNLQNLTWRNTKNEDAEVSLSQPANNQVMEDEKNKGAENNEPDSPSIPLVPEPSIPVPENPTQPEQPSPPVFPKPETNYSVLEAYVSEADGLNKEEYITASYNALLQEVNVAKHLLAERNATQEQVDQQVSHLQAALSQLVKRGNKQALTGLLLLVNSINREAYTSDSLAVLDQVVQIAKELITAIDVTQEQLDNCAQQVRQAMNQLQKKEEIPSLEELNQLIFECEAIQPEEYTSTSFEVFKEELEKAKRLVQREDLTEEAVRAQIQALQQAKTLLVKKVDKTVLFQLIEEINALQKELYTEDSWDNLQQALTIANAIFMDENATQEQVNEAIQALEVARHALVEKVEENF